MVFIILLRDPRKHMLLPFRRRIFEQTMHVKDHADLPDEHMMHIISTQALLRLALDPNNVLKMKNAAVSASTKFKIVTSTATLRYGTETRSRQCRIALRPAKYSTEYGTARTVIRSIVLIDCSAFLIIKCVVVRYGTFMAPYAIRAVNAAKSTANAAKWYGIQYGTARYLYVRCTLLGSSRSVSRSFRSEVF